MSVETIINNEQKEPERKEDLLTMLMKNPEFKELLLKKALENGGNR